jgi:hypothetical protein
MMARIALLSTVLALVAASSSSRAQIPAGYEIVPISDDPDHDRNAQINDCGEVVWDKELGNVFERREIFLYDNGKTRRLTDDWIADWYPVINERGVVAWNHRRSSDDSRIHIYESGRISELFPGRSVDINRVEHLTFKRYGEPSCAGPAMNIFFYDGQTLRQVTQTSELAHQSPSLNDSDELVWEQYDFCPNPWVSDILFQSDPDGETVQLTALQKEPVSPMINNAGLIVWQAKDYERGYQRYIQVWEDGETRTVIFPGSGPKLNDLGDIGFSSGAAWLYLDGEIIEIPYEDARTSMRDINNHREAVITINFEGVRDLAYMRRIRTGESDFDGDVDLDDAASLHDCLTGPGDFDRLCDCRFLDIDHDRDVDLGDFVLFQRNYTGAK